MSKPLRNTPLVVAMKDLPIVFEEAAACLGATRWQTYRRIVLPLIGPGLSAGLLLSFIIVFNEYLVTLFVHPPGLETAPLRVLNQIRTAGLAPTTAALTVTMQLISFGAILLRRLDLGGRVRLRLFRCLHGTRGDLGACRRATALALTAGLSRGSGGTRGGGVGRGVVGTVRARGP